MCFSGRQLKKFRNFFSFFAIFFIVTRSDAVLCQQLGVDPELYNYMSNVYVQLTRRAVEFMAAQQNRPIPERRESVNPIHHRLNVRLQRRDPVVVARNEPDNGIQPIQRRQPALNERNDADLDEMEPGIIQPTQRHQPELIERNDADLDGMEPELSNQHNVVNQH